ncbi:hypothetical protein [Haloarcula sp. JP-L23]|uniref:hypothetical protein n=1 Tax=Haloarcula sp. JP-L23 TaxID=2716717 RepID=UPI00140F00A7|nr:hypothetical protein G9465_21005 [Haloarcula sp. JP-L23]
MSYKDALTVGWSSPLFILGSIPVVTLGASILALSEMWIEIITSESKGRPVSERERFETFVSEWRNNILAGLPYSILFIVIVGGGYLYLVVGATSGNILALLWALLSLYLIVIALIWMFRAASIRMRSVPEDRSGFRYTMERAAYSLAEEPAFTVLYFVWGGFVISLSQIFPPAFVLLGPGILAVTETVAFEELFGDGAERIRFGYVRR